MLVTPVPICGFAFFTQCVFCSLKYKPNIQSRIVPSNHQVLCSVRWFPEAFYLQNNPVAQDKVRRVMTDLRVFQPHVLVWKRHPGPRKSRGNPLFKLRTVCRFACCFLPRSQTPSQRFRSQSRHLHHQSQNKQMYLSQGSIKRCLKGSCMRKPVRSLATK